MKTYSVPSRDFTSSRKGHSHIQQTFIRKLPWAKHCARHWDIAMSRRLPLPSAYSQAIEEKQTWEKKILDLVGKYGGLAQAKTALEKDRGGTEPLPGGIREGLIDKVTTDMGHKGRCLPDREGIKAFQPEETAYVKVQVSKQQANNSLE